MSILSNSSKQKAKTNKDRYKEDVTHHKRSVLTSKTKVVPQPLTKTQHAQHDRVMTKRCTMERTHKDSLLAGHPKRKSLIRIGSGSSQLRMLSTRYQRDCGRQIQLLESQLTAKTECQRKRA
jgi:hypothetical protein